MPAKQLFDASIGEGDPGVADPSAIDDAFAQRGYPVGAFLFTQSSAASTWTVNHNLGQKPAVTLLTTGGAEFEAEILHLSDNQFQVYLATPTAGQARCT